MLNKKKKIFFFFISYGRPIYTRKNEQLFTIAYLARKFKVTGLTKIMDGLLKYLPSIWQPNDLENWKITFNICKWLELDQTQLAIMDYLKMREGNGLGSRDETMTTFGGKKRRRDEEESVSSSSSSSYSSSESSTQVENI